MKRTKSTSSQTYIVRRLWGAHSTQPFFLRIKKNLNLKTKPSFISLTEIKSYPHHLILQLRKLLQNSTWKTWSLFYSILNLPSRSKTGYSKDSSQKLLFPNAQLPVLGNWKGVNVGVVVQQQPAFSQGFSAWGVQGWGGWGGSGRDASRRLCRFQ